MTARLLILTGGSRGLGAALLDHFVSAEWTVVELSRNGSSPHHRDCDLSDMQATRSVMHSICHEHASQNWDEVVFLHNAGTLSPIGRIMPDDLLATMDHLSINFTALTVMAAQFQHFFQNHDCRKSLVTISSGAASSPYPGWSLYCASKAAADMYIRAMAEEQKSLPHPIRALAIRPGVIDTDMQAQIRNSIADDFPMRDKFIELREQNKLLTPQQSARAVATVIESSVDNGSVIDIRDWQ